MTGVFKANIIAPKMDWREAFIILCMLLHSVLDIYAVSSSLTFGNVADLLVFALCLTKKRQDNKIPYALWLYIVYRIIISFVTAFTIGVAVPIGFLLQVGALYSIFRTVNLSNFIKIYKILGYVITIFLIIQYVSLTVFDVRINGVMNFLPIAIGEGNFLSVLDMRIRPSSIFSEPAHYAEFILPLLAIELFDDNRKKSISLIIFIVVGLILSMSGTAILGLIVLGIMYLVKLIVLHASFKKTWWVLILVTLLPIGYSYYAKSELGGMVLERTDAVMEASQSLAVSSEYVRIFRGYDIFGELKFANIIFGCGNKENIIKQIATTNYSTMFDKDNFYFNGVATILLYSGLIGLLIYLLVFKSLWTENSICGKTFIVLLFSLMLIASIVINALGAVMIFLASAYKKENLHKFYTPPLKDEC